MVLDRVDVLRDVLAECFETRVDQESAGPRLNARGFLPLTAVLLHEQQADAVDLRKAVGLDRLALNLDSLQLQVCIRRMGSQTVIT